MSLYSRLVKLGALRGVTNPGTGRVVISSKKLPQQLIVGTYALAAEVPTVTVGAAGAASSIASSIRVYPAFKDATYADHLNDSVFRIAGVPDGKMLVSPSNTIEGALFTGAASGGSTSYWQPFIETAWFGSQIEFRLRSKFTGTVYYRLYIDGKPITDAFQSFAGVSGSAYNILLTFGFAGSRVVGIEFAFAQFGGVYVEPVSSLSRPKIYREGIAFLGNSILGGAGTVTRHSTWAGNAARLLNMDCYNASVGQTGFIAVAPYAARVEDIKICKPKVVVLGDPYNDLGYSKEAIRDATRQTFDAVKVACPFSKVIVLGCWSPSQSPTETQQARDMDQQALAREYGFQFLSYRDPGDCMDTTAAWAPGVAYTVGRQVVNAGIVWGCTVAHTAGTVFDATRFAARSLVTDANAGAVLLNDALHPSEQFHKAIGALMARRIAQML